MGGHGHSHGHGDGHGHQHQGHRYPGSVERLRSPERMALLEVGHVVDLCLEGVAVRSALDVGTGSGVFAEELDRRGVAVSGIDVAPEMIGAARRHVPTAQFQEAAADHLPFGDDTFDLVFLGHVLHEVGDAVLALQEARRVARARVVVLEWPYAEGEPGPPLEHRLRDEAITAFAGEAGFQGVERLALAHMVLYRLAP